MNLEDLALAIEATMHPGTGYDSIRIARIYAADTMSDLIAHASSDTLIVTSLNNAQLVRIAELMDAPAICLAGGADPGQELLAAARGAGKVIIVSPLNPAEIRSRLERHLGELEVRSEPGAQPA